MDTLIAADPGLPRDRRSLVLVGLMGAGKTSVGRHLAVRLGLPFVDADCEIEKAAGLSIAEIFARFGEPYFREGERRVISRLLQGERLVLATGGGAFMDEETRRLIAARGRSIWLRADLDTLVRRCARRDHRPLLKSGDARDTLARLMAVRYPVYAEADITIDSGEGPHDLIVAEILHRLTAEEVR